MFASGKAELSRAEETPQQYVAVQFAVPDVQRATIGPEQIPTLEEQGFASLPVPAGMSQDEFIAQLKQDPAIASAEPDAVVYGTAITPNDQFYGSQKTYLEAIGAQAAWDYTTGDAEVVVAVLDTGVDTMHPELKEHLWVNTAEISANGKDDDGNGCIDDVHGCRFINATPDRVTQCAYTSSEPRGLVRDDHGKPGPGDHSHGTLVAGILAAAGNNGDGTAGIAWNVRIMPVKVLDCGTKDGRPTGEMTNVARGIEYARLMGADIINLSLANREGESNGDLLELRAAIQAAQAEGIIVVAAAGNHSGSQDPSTGYPAAYSQYPLVIGVGGANSDLTNTWLPGSNYGGDGIDFAAPAKTIAGPTRTDREGSYYGTNSGTSMAAPLVAGTFALLRSKNPALTSQELIDIAKLTATPGMPAPHEQNWAGAGIINAGKALARLPMVISGVALHDWDDVLASTPIRATIDGVECGLTAATTVSGEARYTLRVLPEAEQAGCGAPGDTVEITIGGSQATTTFEWPGQNGTLAFPNSEITSVSEPPGGLVVQSMVSGWNLIAQIESPGTLPMALANLPGDWDEIAAWNAAENRYDVFSKNVPTYVNTMSSIALYDAFWVRSTGGNIATLNPEPGPREVELEAGWNVVLYTGDTKRVDDALQSIAGKYTAVMHFENLTRTWRSYHPGQPRTVNDFGGLLPMRIYWIAASAPATLVIE